MDISQPESGACLWLLVESQGFRHACTRVLRSLPARTRFLASTGEALRALGELGPSDALVVDLDFPGVAGSGFLDELRSHPLRPGAVLLARQALPGSVLSPGWILLTRPFESRDLAEAARSVLARRQDGDRE